MLIQAWTHGEAVQRGRNKRELLQLRENTFGDRPTDDHSGTSFDQHRHWIKTRWPFLVLPHPTTDWEDIKAKLADGWVGVLHGDPRDCPESSPLRRWLPGDDDYGHYVYADHREEGKGFWIMDPLGGWDGGRYTNYQGEWVPDEDVRLFLKNRPDGAVLVQRGSMTAEGRGKASEREKWNKKKAAWDADKAALQAQIAMLTGAAAAQHEEWEQAKTAWDAEKAALQAQIAMLTGAPPPVLAPAR